MEVPLIKDASRLILPGIRRASFHIASAPDDDAVKVSLSSDAATLAKAAAPRRDGYLAGLFGEVQSIASRLSDLNKRLGTALNPSQTQAVKDEIQRLGEEYSGIFGGSAFDGARSTLEAVNSLVGSADGDALNKSLSSSASILGSEFLTLASTRDTVNLNKVSAAFDSLSKLSFDDILAPGGIERLSALATSGLAALDSAHPDITPAASAPVTESTNEGLAPLTLVSRQFVPSNGITIALNGFTGTDLLKAAVTHAVTDPKLASYITVQLPKEEDALKDKYFDPAHPDASREKAASDAGALVDTVA